jgi:hypothetical protein
VDTRDDKCGENASVVRAKKYRSPFIFMDIVVYVCELKYERFYDRFGCGVSHPKDLAE